MNIFSNDISLDTIKEPVEYELKCFDNVLRESMRSKIPLVDLIIRYIIKQKGKRIRPLLVMLSAKICGDINQSTYRAATLIEILHTASLVHDDVVDEAEARRGFPSINSIWKNKVAVLMGDYLLSKGLLVSLEQDDFYFLKSTSQAVKRMSEGELLQIQKSRQLNIDEQTYLKIISDKTASLFSTCADIGAASTTDNQETIDLLKSYGEYLGIAFQIRDDVLDYLGRKSIIGKPIGGDIKEKKLTLPLIYALTKCSKSDAKNAINIIKKGAKNRDIDWIINFVKDLGGLDYAINKSDEYAQKAQQCLNTFKNTPEKISLHNLASFAIQRNK